MLHKYYAKGAQNNRIDYFNQLVLSNWFFLIFLYCKVWMTRITGSEKNRPERFLLLGCMSSGVPHIR
jgi:hypothetical protein